MPAKVHRRQLKNILPNSVMPAKAGIHIFEGFLDASFRWHDRTLRIMDMLKQHMMWAYAFSDYCEMFGLTQEDLKKSIMDVGGKGSSFNAEMYSMDRKIISCDPFYALSLEKISQALDKSFEQSEEWIKDHFSQFNHQEYASPEIIFNHQKKAIDRFKHDFSLGAEQNRYQAYELSAMPFPNDTFELVLYVHAFFDPQVTVEAIVLHIKELTRVGMEVRLFPLLDHTGAISALLGPLLLLLQQQSFGVEIKQVAFELQKGGNALLRVWPQGCELSP